MSEVTFAGLNLSEVTFAAAKESYTICLCKEGELLASFPPLRTAYPTGDVLGSKQGMPPPPRPSKDNHRLQWDSARLRWVCVSCYFHNLRTALRSKCWQPSPAVLCKMASKGTV